MRAAALLLLALAAQAAAPAGKPEPRVSLELENERLDRVLAAVGKRGRRVFEVDPELRGRRATVVFNRLPVSQAVEALALGLGAQVEPLAGKDRYFVSPVWSPKPPPSTASRATDQRCFEADGELQAVECVNGSLASFLRIASRRLGASYVVVDAAGNAPLDIRVVLGSLDAAHRTLTDLGFSVQRVGRGSAYLVGHWPRKP